MTQSYADVLNHMQKQKVQHQVEVLMTVHGDNGEVFYGYGAMVYAQAPVLASVLASGYVVEALTPSPQTRFKILNSMAYNTRIRGSWGEYQTFVVEESAVEYWEMSIERLVSSAPFKFGAAFPPPTLSIGMATYRPRPTYTVVLDSHGSFLSGTGESPFDAAATARYTFTFGAIGPYQEIG